MDANHTRRHEADGVLTLTFTRGDKLNAVSPQMVEALSLALDDLAARDELKVLLITAEGRYFTAGIDVGSMQTAGNPAASETPSGATFRLRYRRLHDLFDRIEASEKPVVLAVQGPCLGFGVELGASCDFRLAAETASFSLPEIANLAMIPGSGGISRLARLIGPHWTAWLALAGEAVGAGDARMMGLVHAVHPDAEFSARAQAFAARLAQLPGEAVALGKLALRSALYADRASARDFDRVANTLLARSEDHAERMRAFAERSARRKRPG